MTTKKFTPFHLTDAFNLSATELAELLSRKRFVPCGPTDPLSIGWVANTEGDFARELRGCIFFTLQVQKKSVPAQIVKEALEVRVAAFLKQQGSRPGKKVIREMKDDIVQSLLPKAFPKTKEIECWIDTTDKWLIVGGTPADSEVVVESFKVATDEIPFKNVVTLTTPSVAMTSWVRDSEISESLMIDRDCEMAADIDATSKIKFSNHALDDSRVQEHIAAGKCVVKLAVSHQDGVSFVLDKNLSISKLAFSDLISTKLTEDSGGDESALRDATMLLTLESVRTILKELTDLLVLDQ